MPYGYYKIFTPSDLEAVVAYVRSLPAVSSKVPASVYKVGRMHVEIPPGADHDAGERHEGSGEARVLPRHHRPLHGMPLAARGRAQRSECARQSGEGSRAVGRERVAQHHFAPGRRPRRLERSGDQARDHARRRQGGRKLLPPMGFAWYARLTEPDLDAIVAYLRTVPPLE